MPTKRVQVGREYWYVPVLLDRCHPPYNVSEGDRVVVVNLHGCPPANTMGHCHVNHADPGKGTFAGLVCCNSLLTASEYREYLQAKIARIEEAHAVTP